MLALYRFIPAVNGFQEGLFTGWCASFDSSVRPPRNRLTDEVVVVSAALACRFGPIGVSALYYAILARENIPEDRVALHTVIFPVVIFMAMASTCIHVCNSSPGSRWTCPRLSDY